MVGDDQVLLKNARKSIKEPIYYSCLFILNLYLCSRQKGNIGDRDIKNKFNSTQRNSKIYFLVFK